MSISVSEVCLESFGNICRICLTYPQDVLIPISEIYFSQLNKNGSLEGIHVSEVLGKYCNVQMHDYDCKPPNLCKPCIGMVYRAYSILEKFLESDRILDGVIAKHKQPESVVNIEIEEPLTDPLNYDNSPAGSCIDVDEREESASFLGHEATTKNCDDIMTLENDENEKNTSNVSHTQDHFFGASETLSTHSKCDNAESKYCASFNSTTNDKGGVQNSVSNHNSSEDNKDEIIILIQDNKKSDDGELQSLIKILERNVVDCDDKTYLDDKCKDDKNVRTKAKRWDHTYSRDEQELKNVIQKRTKKKLLQGAKKPETVCPTKRIPYYPVEKFSVFNCNACENVQFDDIEKVIEHIKAIHPTLKKCIMCPRVLLHPEYLIVHVASHSHYGRFICRKCLLVFKSEEELQNHKASAEHKAPFSCDTCGKLFTLRSSWRVHNEVIHKKGNKQFFQCWICGLVLKWARNYKGHLRSHKIYPSNKSHLCEFCAKGFYDKTSLMKHIAAMHEKDGKPRKGAGRANAEKVVVDSYKCEYCPKAFSTRGSHFAHRISHPECDNIACRFCEEVFSSLKDYKTHKLSVHSSFVCDICKKGFASKERLGAHTSLHKGDFKCKFCDVSFKTGQRRKIHEYVHTNERPHQCQICGSRFKQMTHLARHIECLHTEKRFVCKICGRRCQFESSYKNHLRSHTGMKPFLCPYCLKDYRDTTIRHRHVKREHPELFQDFLLYKKEHQDEEVKRVESLSDKFNPMLIKEEEEDDEEEEQEYESMFSALLSTEDEDDKLE